MSLLHGIRLFVQRFGIDVARYPGLDPMHLLVQQLSAHRVDLVLDVGANAGRYGEELRRAGYRGRIASFEPLTDQFEVLRTVSSSDASWQAFQYALGDENGTVTMNVAANAGESSSILPMLNAHVDAYPAASYVGTQETPLHTLDFVAPDIVREHDRVFLKADVQGYERPVLAGATSTLRDHCVGLQLELSLVPLYEGGMLYREAIEFADAHGYALTGLIPGFTDLRDGRMLQADGIFFGDR